MKTEKENAQPIDNEDSIKIMPKMKEKKSKVTKEEMIILMLIKSRNNLVISLVSGL